MDKHDEIHGFPSGGSNVGVTPGELIVSAIEADARAQQGASSGGGSGLGQAGMSSGGLASFSLYWDVATKAWKCHEPLVIGPDGSGISVDEPEGGYGNGTYYLHVKFDSDAGTYSAEIKTGGSTGSDDEIAVVKLFTIADTEDGTVQYHTGVVNLAQMTITGEEGETEGSDPTPVSGQVYMSGDASSGLKVRTFKSGEEKHVCLDIDGRESGDSFGVHEVTDSEGAKLGKVFATADIKIPKGGGGDNEVDAIVGISFDWNGNNLICNLKKKKVSGVTVGDEFDGGDVTVCEGEAMDIVTNVEYTSSHALEKTVVPSVTILSSGGGSAETKTVFETTEHSKE